MIYPYPPSNSPTIFVTFFHLVTRPPNFNQHYTTILPGKQTKSQHIQVMLHRIQHLPNKSSKHHYRGKSPPLRRKSRLPGAMLIRIQIRPQFCNAQKASRAAFALSSMLDNAVSASTINKLFNQLIEPILPYIHPRKVDQVRPTKNYASLNTQLSMEQVWKGMIYTHYSLHSTTPILGVRADLGMFPTYIPAIMRLAKYMAYLVEDNSNTLVQKAVITHKAMASKSKYSWWSNTWRLLSGFHIILQQYPPTIQNTSKENSRGSTAGGGLCFWPFPPTCPN